MEADSARPLHGWKLAGYKELVSRFGVRTVGHFRTSVIADTPARTASEEGGRLLELFPRRYDPGESSCAQLDFALRHDGINLEILSGVFAALDPQELVTHLKRNPYGRRARRLWYLYELLTGRQLALDDLKSARPAVLLDPRRYHTAAPRLVARQQIQDNLLGGPLYCPLVRRTETLERVERLRLDQKYQKFIQQIPFRMLPNTISDLYAREIDSSFAIENAQLDPRHNERFAALLRLADQEDFCQRSALFRLQNAIVEEPFVAADFRKTQNYIGETTRSGQMKVLFVPPRPADLPSLMEGMNRCNLRMRESAVHPVVHAATISFGFLFIHPFEDGNGRIHRFLIHNILATSGYTPKGVLFPISATILNQLSAYNELLEAFSRPLLPLIDYRVDLLGALTVQNDTAVHFRFLDMTPFVEGLYRFIEATIEGELISELQFEEALERARASMRAVVPLPEERLELFARLCFQSRGTLPAKRWFGDFPDLTEEEVHALERAVRQIYAL